MSRSPSRSKNRHVGGVQLPMFETPSEWTPPTEFPDLSYAKYVGFDCETKDPDLVKLGPGFLRGDARVVGVSLATETGFKIYLPFGHASGNQLPQEKVVDYVRAQVSRDNQVKVGANVMYDIEALDSLGIQVRGPVHDIQVAGPLLDEEKVDGFSLEQLSLDYLGVGKTEGLLEEAANNWGLDKKRQLWMLDPKYVGPYAEDDALNPVLVLQKQLVELERQRLLPVWDLECDLTPVLWKMRKRGVRVDLDGAAQLAREIAAEEQELLHAIRLSFGSCRPGFDPWDTKQMYALLKEEGLESHVPFTKPTKNFPHGQPSITNEWLKQYTHLHTGLKHSLEYRNMNKMRRDFVEGLVINRSIRGRLHPQWHQLKADDEDRENGTKTGRVASSKPNLTQIPSRHPRWGKKVRALFVADEGGKWCKHDYCFSRDTEVLTRLKGFIRFEQLSDEDEVAQYDPLTGAIDYCIPVSKQRIPYKGDMVHVKGTWATDLLMSPNHRCLLLSVSHRRPYEVKASDYMSRPGYQVCAGLVEGGVPANITDLRLSVACQADGQSRTTHYRLFVKKTRKIERLAQLTGLEPVPVPSKPGFAQFNVPHTLAPYVVPGPDKLFDRHRLLSLDSRSRRAFIEETLLWDGSGRIGSKATYTTTVRHNADVVQEVATLTGLRANVVEILGEGRKPFYTVSFGRKADNYTGKYESSLVPYDDEIFCVTMPKSTVVVRREGKVSITFQSQQEPRIALHFAYLKRYEGAAEARQKYLDDPTTDYHDMTKDLIFERSGIVVERRVAKDINLGSAYGMGKYKLAAKLGLDIDAAAEILEIHRKGVPFLKKLEERCMELVHAQGYIRTLSGRKRRFDSWEAEDWKKRSFPIRDYDEAVQQYGKVVRAFAHKALNAMVQGTAADQTKTAIILLDREGLAPQLQVYDELCQTVYDDKAPWRIKEIMETALSELTVPHLANPDLGGSWGTVDEKWANNNAPAGVIV